MWLGVFIQLLKEFSAVVSKGMSRKVHYAEFYYPQLHLSLLSGETIGFEMMNIFGPFLIWLLCTWTCESGSGCAHPNKIVQVLDQEEQMC